MKEESSFTITLLSTWTHPKVSNVAATQIQPTSFAFTLLLGFLAAVPYSGIDINLPALAATALRSAGAPRMSA